MSTNTNAAARVLLGYMARTTCNGCSDAYRRDYDQLTRAAFIWAGSSIVARGHYCPACIDAIRAEHAAGHIVSAVIEGAQ